MKWLLVAATVAFPFEVAASTIVCPWADGRFSFSFSADRTQVMLLHNQDRVRKLPVTPSAWSVDPDEGALHFSEEIGEYVYAYEFYGKDDLAILANWRTQKAGSHLGSERITLCSRIEDLDVLSEKACRSARD